jgi:hypothetical protein
MVFALTLGASVTELAGKRQFPVQWGLPTNWDAIELVSKRAIAPVEREGP